MNLWRTTMQRRLFVMAGAAGIAPGGWAHHGWSSFDTDRPLYLEGRAGKVAWRNPHAELELELQGPLKLPEGIQSLALPEQSAQIDRAALLAKTTLPTRKDTRWLIELAPLSRMNAWKVAEIKP